MAADVHALSGAYVLDSIEPLDRVGFEAHLAGCPSCQQEVAAFRDTAVVLASITAAHPPAGLRQRLLAAIRRTPQLRPRMIGQPPRSATPARFVRLLAVAGAVAVLGGAMVTGLDPDAPPVTGPITASTVLVAEDAQVREIERDAGEFQMASSPRLGLIAVVARTSELPPDRVYQLWVMTDTARSLALLEGGQAVASPPAQGRLAITVEPAGGSPQPTTIPLVVLNVSSFHV